MKKVYEICYDTRMWTYDTNSITDLPTDEEGEKRFKEDMKGLVESLIHHVPGVKSFTFQEPSEDDDDMGLPVLFEVSIESDEDLSKELHSKINNYITDEPASRYCDDLSAYQPEEREFEGDEDEEEEEENGSDWNLEEVTIELFLYEK